MIMKTLSPPGLRTFAILNRQAQWSAAMMSTAAISAERTVALCTQDRWT